MRRKEEAGRRGKEWGSWKEGLGVGKLERRGGRKGAQNDLTKTKH